MWHGVAAELPPPGRGAEAGLAPGSSPGSPADGVVAGWAPGDRLGHPATPPGFPMTV